MLGACAHETSHMTADINPVTKKHYTLKVNNLHEIELFRLFAKLGVHRFEHTDKNTYTIYTEEPFKILKSIVEEEDAQLEVPMKKVEDKNVDFKEVESPYF